MPISFRKASESDASEMTLLSDQLGYSMRVEQTLAAISIINESANDALYVAVNGDTVIGWMHVLYTVRVVCAPYCEITALIVDARQRGKGIGRDLITHCLPWCKDKMSSKLVVRTNVIRTDTHRFYSS